MSLETTEQIENLEKLTFDLRRELLKINCTKSVEINYLKKCSGKLNKIITELARS